jgi:lysophospholipase L1-like esterase
MTTLVCLGDSFTEGLCDDLRPDGRHLGWADRVALGLAQAGRPVRYANLAVRGKLIDQVIADQVPQALVMQPDVVTFHAGLNDILRPRGDVRRVLAEYEWTVVRLREERIEVVLFTSITRHGSGPLADRLAWRFEEFNSEVRRIAAAYGCLLIDNGAVAPLADRRMWAQDRVHLSPEGHRRVAAKVLHTLGVQDPAVLGGQVGWWEVPLPEAPSASPVHGVVAEARWVWVHLMPWIGRRLLGTSSGDHVAPKDEAVREVVAARGT